MQTYFGYEISGACFNPAIALAQFLGGNLGESKKDFKTLGLYILVEMLGGFAGAIIGYMPRPSGIFCPEPNPYFNMGEVMLNEFFWTTGIAYVVLTTMFTEETKGKHYFGWAVGMMYGAALGFGTISGYSFNPAVGVNMLIAAAIQKPDNDDCADDNMKYIWIYALFPFIGAVAGWGLHRLTNGKHYGDGKFDKIAPYVQEFVGTFFICYTLGSSSVINNMLSVMFYVGGVVTAMVFCGGHVSGGQYNPAVSLGVFIRGSQTIIKTLIFWGMQCLGAFTGAFMAYLVTRYGSSKGSDFLDNGGTALVPPAPHLEGNGKTDLGGIILLELVFTFAVTFAFLATTTAEEVAANSFFGYAVGFASFVYGAVGIGGAFNPASWLGLNIVYAFHENGDPFADFWAYWIAEFVGGALAALLFRWLMDIQGKVGTTVQPIVVAQRSG